MEVEPSNSIHEALPSGPPAAAAAAAPTDAAAAAAAVDYMETADKPAPSSNPFNSDAVLPAETAAAAAAAGAATAYAAAAAAAAAAVGDGTTSEASSRSYRCTIKSYFKLKGNKKPWQVFIRTPEMQAERHANLRSNRRDEYFCMADDEQLQQLQQGLQKAGSWAEVLRCVTELNQQYAKPVVSEEKLRYFAQMPCHQA
jgi:hypothetical protein